MLGDRRETKPGRNAKEKMGNQISLIWFKKTREKWSFICLDKLMGNKVKQFFRIYNHNEQKIHFFKFS